MTVHTLKTPTQNLANIPHMLRWWASYIEAEEAGGGDGYVVAGLALLKNGAAKPTFAILGGEEGGPDPHPLWMAGVFDYCRQQLIQAAYEVEDA